MGSVASPPGAPSALGTAVFEPEVRRGNALASSMELEGKIQEARLAEMLGKHYEAVWRAVRRFGVPANGADDAAQEVFIVAARKLDTIESEGERRFLLGVAVRVASNARRARAARPEQGDAAMLEATPSDAPGADTLLEAKELRELLDLVLDELSDELRTVFVLFEIEELSTPEIAALLELPVGTAASRLRRAREVFELAARRVRARLRTGALP